MGEELRIQTEQKHFQCCFKELKDKKIVLYGLGKLTALLVPQLGKEWKLIGLMDKDPNNIGRIVYGLPVLAKDQVMKQADAIIIYTSAAYWNIIYQRIQDINIPIYFRDGTLAKPEKAYGILQDLSADLLEIQQKIRHNEIISFDMFDTLVMRQTFLPRTIWELVDVQCTDLGIDFLQLRTQAQAKIAHLNPTLDEIYTEMQKMAELSDIDFEQIKQLELQMDLQFIVPRKDMVPIFKEAVSLNKPVYIISDMYYTADVLGEILEKCGFTISYEHIIVSCEKRKNKKEGTLWSYYQKEYVHGRRAFHVGDDSVGDVKQPQAHGISACKIMSAIEQLQQSSWNCLVPNICSPVEAVIMGLVIANIFNSPFVCKNTRGKVTFKDRKLLGYCLFGPVLAVFLLWVLECAKKESIEGLLFLARDGFFLIQDYDYLCSLMEDNKYPKAVYLEISRLLIMKASIKDKLDFHQLANWAYQGNFEEYLEDRFSIKYHFCNGTGKRAWSEFTAEELEKELEHYSDAIKMHILTIKNEYQKYLSSKVNEGKTAIVDTGYCGNNQYHLSKFMNKKLTGYYMYANVSPDNPNSLCNTMKACFQKEMDPKAEQSNVRKKNIFFDSLLTAPNGMVKGMDQNGNFEYDTPKSNQRFFTQKEEINSGVKDFIYDFITIIKKNNWTLAYVSTARNFVDYYYGCVLDESKVEQQVGESFYFDDAIFQRREMNLFD